MSKRLANAIDICGELAMARTIKDLCNDAVLLMREQLYLEYVGIGLAESPADLHQPYFGINLLGKDIDNEDDVLSLLKDANTKKALMRGKHIILNDIESVTKKRSDEDEDDDPVNRLIAPIRSRNGTYYGYLFADSEEGDEWDDESTEIFRLIATFLSSRISTKKVEFEQSKDRILMRTLIDSLPDYIYIKDLESRFLLVNRKQVEETKAESARDMIGKTDHDYYPKEIADKYRAEELAIINSGEPMLNDVEEILDHNGESRWYMSTKIPVKNDMGNVFCLVGIGIDITERKRFQIQIEESEARFRSLYGSIDDAILVHDEEGGILDCNDTAGDLFGFTEEALLKQSIHTINFPDYEKALINGLKEKQSLKAKITNGENEERSIDIRISRFDYAGKTAYLALMRDVTELEQARIAAEDAATTKSAFLANMSHEIRTPLNAMIGMTALMEDTDLNPEQYDFIRTIRTSGESLLSIINEILDISKIEAGQMRLEEVPFNLQSCVEDALDIVSIKAAEKELELTYGIFGNLPNTFIGDAPRLRQVLLNLLSNSIKFTEEGEVVVRISGLPSGDDQYRINFSVADTGIGMTPAQTEIIFQPFRQADFSTTRKYGGTGLGLAICNKLVDMMGGDIDVKSEMSVGSEFFFHIMLKPTKDQDVETPAIHPDMLIGKRALIVDDNITNLQILEYQLQKWGVTTHPFDSGKETLEKLSSVGDIDIIILDMVMPEMDGIMLAQNLRAQEHLKDKPIMILSSISQPDKVPPDTIDAWLPKPIKQRLLCNVLCSLIQGTSKTKPFEPRKTAIDHELGNHHPLRILLAEDNLVNQKMMIKLLSKLGYDADHVDNGAKVLEAVKEKVYDLILMDIQMPVMDGLEATRRLRATYPADQCPSIVALTAHALHDDKVMSLKSGMSDYVTKPVRMNDLVGALKKVPVRPE